MVNYCCVQGCGRNSRQCWNLIFYTLPKEKERQIEWLKLAGRSDILDKDLDKVNKRICSRHFVRAAVKNRHLCSDAVPSLFLPGAVEEEDMEQNEVHHTNIMCNCCENIIQGFRYKCVMCPDVDLCSRCEMLEAHDQHCVLRIPKPMKFTLTKRVINEIQTLIDTNGSTHKVNQSTNHQVRDKIEFESSDDEPITKYMKQYDSGVDLSEDIKAQIRDEVARVMTVKTSSKKKLDVPKKRAAKETETLKKAKVEDGYVVKPVIVVPELAFADVNNLRENQEVKVEELHHVTDLQEPGMHLKVSDDLSKFMVEVMHR